MNEFAPKDDGKTAGIVSYFTIIGWLVAYFAMYKDNKTALASYQLRQTLLFHLVSIVIYYAVGAILGAIFFTSGVTLGFSLFWIIKVGLLILWIIGLIGAINGETKPIPLIGEKAQSVFSGI
jgi:sulfite exporter TauE/SafE